MDEVSRNEGIYRLEEIEKAHLEFVYGNGWNAVAYGLLCPKPSGAYCPETAECNAGGRNLRHPRYENSHSSTVMTA